MKDLDPFTSNSCLHFHYIVNKLKENKALNSQSVILPVKLLCLKITCAISVSKP